MKRILGILGWLGVVLVLAAVAARFVKPEMTSLYQGLAIAGLVVTLLYTLSQWRDIARSMSGKGARYGSIAAGSVLLMLGILIALNYIASRQKKEWDLTGGGQFTLSEQSKKVAHDLAQPMQVRVYYETGRVNEVTDKLDPYKQQSGNFQVEYIDAERNPARAQQDGIQQYGTVIMEYAGRTERITNLDEQTITNAIIKLVEGRSKKAYFIQGHGERDPNSDDRLGFSGAAARLKNDNFEVANYSLAQQGSLPDDATVVVVAGPQTDYLQPEIDALKAYLAKGGKLVLMIDVLGKPDAAPLTNLVALAKEWGVTVGNNLIVDASGMGRMFNAGPEVPIAAEYPGHPITDNFRFMTAYRLARSITPIAGGTDGHTAQSVVQSSPQSWAEADLKSLASGGGEVALDPKAGDVPGPITIVAAAAAAAPNAPEPAPAEPGAPAPPRPETRVVITGDADFAGNDLLRFQGNGELFANMINWAAQSENLIAIRPKDPQDRRISLTESERAGVWYLAIYIIPGLFLVAGIATWYKRR
jgi:ABC-type uncharacterized transport system involved in gliding motility auxiliary subunit